MPPGRSARRTSALPLLGLLLAGCDAAGQESGPWAVERAFALDAPEDEVRFSRGDVSRPVWRSGAPATLELAPGPGAFLEVEICAAPTATGTAATPESLVAVFERGSVRTDVPGQLLPTRSEPPGWRTARFDLANATPGPFGLRLLVDGQDPGERWVVSNPRVYQRRDRARPNVLLISVDTLRADLLGCYGHDRPTSPRIDELAAASVVFERALTQAPWTLPAYASMLTGQYVESHGVVRRKQRAGDRLVSFVELFADAGYTTAGFVSGTFTDALWGLDQGFDSYDDLGMVTPDGAEVAADPAAPEAMRSAEVRVSSPEITEKAIDWLERHGDRRFLLVAHYFDPHADRVAHEGLSERFAPLARLPVRQPLHTTPANADTARERALYEGEIAFTDRSIGALLDHLEQSGLAENTIVVLTADHGEEFFDRYSIVGHGHSLFNELVRVPLIFRVPGAFDPRRVDAPVGNVDVFPTLAELCDVRHELSPPAGESLIALMQGTGVRSAPVLSALYPPGLEGLAPSTWWRVDEPDVAFLHYEVGDVSKTLLFPPDDVFQTKNQAKHSADTVERLHGYLSSVLPRLRSGAPAASPDLDLSAYERQLDALGYAGDE